MSKEEVKKKLVIYAPILSSLLFVLFDSIPFYFLNKYSINTQFGLTILYCWVCINPELLRPLVILAFGILIDLFNNYLFGFTTLMISIILFIQKKDLSNLLGRSFKMIWVKFLVFIFILNILSSAIFRMLNPDTIINTFEFFYTLTIVLLIFPFVFYFVNYLNNKIIYYVK